MKVEFREISPLRVVGVRHIGPYWEIGEAFGRLGKWLETSGLPQGAMVGVYWDNPQEVAPDQLRSDACTTLPADAVIDDPAVTVFEIPGGTYACARHPGSYSGLPAAWGELIQEILRSGRIPGGGPSFEIYVNDCTCVPETELITDLYEHIQPI